VAQQCPTAIVLGADTVVVLDQEMLGKPRSADNARQMLSRLSGRQHTVITGLAVVHHAQHFVRLDTVRTLVCFRALTPADIDGYLATGEPFDKAGAYAVQGIGGAFVASLEGCYTNVVGLPVRRTAALLHAAGLCPEDRREKGEGEAVLLSSTFSLHPSPFLPAPGHSARNAC
jgi:septum formation protein